MQTDLSKLSVDVLQQLVNEVKTASPFIWHAAYRYVIVDSLMGLSFAAFLFTLAYWFHKRAKLDEDSGDDSTGWHIMWIISLIVGGLFVAYNVEQILALDYSTIQAVIHLVSQ